MSIIRRLSRRLPGAVPILLALCAQAFAASYDLGEADAPLPDVIDAMNSPVYFTNALDGAGPASRAVDSLRIGQYGELHIGYDNGNVAAADIDVAVAGDMDVQGTVRLGKAATNGQRNLPGPATATHIGLAVSGSLRVHDGGHIILNGSGDASDAVMSARDVLLDGGAITLEEFSNLAAGVALAGDAAGAPSIVIRNGGALTVNAGRPDDIGGEWEYGVNAGGGGILAGYGGVLAAGRSGGTIQGGADQTLLTIARGGLLDAGRGDIFVIGDVDIAGSYRAGLDSSLIADSGTVTFAPGASLAMSRELQRYINIDPDRRDDGISLVTASEDVVFENGNGLPPVIASGMGFYDLEVRTDPVDGFVTLDAVNVVNGVVGDRSERDRQRFRDNLDAIWAHGTMNRAQSDNIYFLSADETPRIVAYGADGNLNQAVLEAIVDGPGQAVAGHGVVDKGVFEMYNGGAQWGVNNAAYNVAGEFMAGLDRRVERIGAEMDRLGEGWGDDGLEDAFAVDDAFPSLAMTDADAFDRRFWAGGFGRDETGDLDYGIAGYTYRPRGVMLGYDKTIGSLSLGAAAAYGKGDYVDNAAQSSDSAIASYSAGVYAAYHGMSGLNASAHATVSHVDNELRDIRGGMRREADHTGYSWSVGARVGYDKLLSDRMTVSPSVGISKIQAVGRAHDEYLDGVGVLRVGEVRRDSVLVPLDITLGYDLLRSPSSVLRVTGNLGYAYDFEDGALDGVFSYNGLAGATAMGVAGREAGRHRFNAGAGLIFTGSRFDIGARYDFLKREKQTTHQARGSIGVKF